jgi:histidinol dehydrogenase
VTGRSPVTSQMPAAAPGSAIVSTELRLTRLDLRDPDAATLRARDALFRRGAVPDPAVRAATRAILADVRERGAEAVRDASARFGGGRPDGRLILERSDLATARDALRRDQRAALELAIANVERFALPQRPVSTRTTILPGVELERRWLPVSRVGAYVPGGSAPYPSSLVMTVVPAMVAGVGRIVVASPADRNGDINPVLLGAAGLLDVDALLVAGGVQAIGALAYGLPESGLEPVDVVVGPGSAWVTAAKIEVVGEVAIDLPAGPSEGLVLADASADAATVAADLITQAEHGVDSPALLVTPDEALADAVEREVRRRLVTAARRDILARALAEHGRIVLVRDVEAGIEFVNGYGPEHLSIEVEDLEGAVAAIRNAGSIFVGRWSPESAGDYASGANHVLPTGGLARACGPLAVETFGKYNQVQRITRDGLARLRPAIRTLAEAEGLLAHRDAVEARFPGEAPAAAEPAAGPGPARGADA